MSEVNINYKGATIAGMDASGTKTLLTQGKYCEDDIDIVYNKPAGTSYTLLGSTELTANTTSTSNTSLGSITVSAAWTKAKIIYVRVRDKAGPRAGYFYGSDVWFINANAGNNGTSTFTTGARAIIRYSTSNQYAVYSGTGYGVFGYDINSSGRVRIYTRYNSTNSLTINGTYVCEVYALNWPDNVSPFS